MQNFALIIFLCDHFRPKYLPGAQLTEIFLMETGVGSKLGFSDELELLVEGVFCAEFYAEFFCL